LGVDVLTEIISGLVSIAIAYYAFKCYTLIKESPLFYLNLSFSLLAAGFLTHGVVKARILVLATIRHKPPLPIKFLGEVSFAYMICFIAQASAYLLLIYAYLRQTKWLAEAAPALLLVLKEYDQPTEAILFFLMTILVSQASINYSARKTSGALLVLTGFSLMAVSHLLFIFVSLGPKMLVAAGIARLLGFLSLLTMLLRAGRGGR